MYNVVIIEDEKPAARRLQRLLVENNLHVVEILHSVKQSIEWFENNQPPDLIFVDIQLSDGISFDIFDHIKIHSPIIFTTAYDSYALKAFKLNSVDYLLKPIAVDELQQSILKFKNQVRPKNEDISVEIKKIKELLNQNEAHKERFTVFVGSSIKLLEVSDIACIVSVEKASYAYNIQGKEYLLEGSLEKIFEQLNPKLFFKVNRKFVVQLQQISEIISYSSNRLELKLKNFSGEKIIVAREKVKEFKDWLS